MDDFYFFTIFVVLFSFASNRLAFMALIVGVFYFLTILPDTGQDYSRYQDTFTGGYVISEFPFFKTHATIDAEPLYLWYNSLMSFLLNKRFPLFLAINFIVCVIISKSVFKGVYSHLFYLFWLFILPVIIPTIFYFSPRSSISFFLILLAFTNLVRAKYVFFGLATLACISIHSQFILISVLMLATYLVLYYKSDFKFKESKKLIVIGALVLTILLVFINNFSSTLEALLSYLPSSDIAQAKLHYLETARDGFRLTSILSIVIYPLMAHHLLVKIQTHDLLIFKNPKYNTVFLLLLFAVVCYGAAINIAYFNNPHLAGRLSRFSDYLGMGILLPLYFLNNYQNALLKPVMLFLILISPILFASLYSNVNWGF